MLSWLNWLRLEQPMSALESCAKRLELMTPVTNDPVVLSPAAVACNRLAHKQALAVLNR